MKNYKPINYELKYLQVIGFLQYNYPDVYDEWKEEEGLALIPDDDDDE